LSEWCRCFSPNACLAAQRCASTHKRLHDVQDNGAREMSEAAYVLLKLLGSDFVKPGTVHVPTQEKKDE
jgi:hypothetical protein